MLMIRNVWLRAGLVALLLITSLSGCSKTGRLPGRGQTQEGESAQGAVQDEPAPDPSTPGGAVSELLERARGWDPSLLDEWLPPGADAGQYIPEALQETLRQVLSRMQYRVGETRIDGDTAAVDLQVEAVDIESAVDGATRAVALHVAKQKILGRPLGNYAEIAQVAVDAIDIPSLPTKSAAVTAHLVRREDGEWHLDTHSDKNIPLLNAASGGAIDLVRRFQDLAGQYGLPSPP